MTPLQMVEAVRLQLRAAGETMWARYPLQTDFPCFRTADTAARNALTLFDGPWLVMRDPCLRPMREAVLVGGRTLVIPDRSGEELLHIPASALSRPVDGRSPLLSISPAPRGSTVYRGAVQAVVVGCHAFDPLNRCVYGLDTCRTERLLGDLRDGMPDGWQLPDHVAVLVLASDAQQVQGWGEVGLAHDAHFVVTATRLIALGRGDEERFDEGNSTPVEADAVREEVEQKPGDH